MAYRFNPGGGGASNSTSWNSATAKDASKHARIAQYGKVVGVHESPHFPRTAAEYKKHFAEWAVLKHAAEKQAMEHRIEDMEAERKTGVKVLKGAMFRLGLAGGVNKLVAALAGPASLKSAKYTKKRNPFSNPAVAKVWGAPPNPGLQNMWNYPTGGPSIWAENHSSDAPWPERDERKHYGEKRAADGLQRTLPPPRANQVDIAQIKWMIDSKIPKDVAMKYVKMDLVDVPWELKMILPGYELTAEAEEMVKAHEQWKVRFVKGKGKAVAEAADDADEPLPEGWKLDEAELRGTGAWGGLFDEIHKTG